MSMWKTTLLCLPARHPAARRINNVLQNQAQCGRAARARRTALGLNKLQYAPAARIMNRTRASAKPELRCRKWSSRRRRDFRPAMYRWRRAGRRSYNRSRKTSIQLRSISLPFRPFRCWRQVSFPLRPLSHLYRRRPNRTLSE